MEHFLKWVNDKTGVKPYETNRIEVFIEEEHGEQYRVIETRRCKLTGEILGSRNILYPPDGTVVYRIPSWIDEDKGMFDYEQMVMTNEEFEIICDTIHASPTNPERYAEVYQELLQKGFS